MYAFLKKREKHKKMEILIPLFVAILGLIGQGISNRTNRKNVMETNEANRQINQEQMAHADAAAEAADQRTRRLFTDIESPEAKVRQYMDAGLSPGLMYGQSGNGGSLAAGAQAQTPALLPMMASQVSPLLDVQTAMQAAEANAKIKNLNADTQEKIKDLPLKDQMLENLKQELLTKKQEIAESQERVNKMFAERMHEYQKSGLTQKQKELTEAQTAYQEALEKITSIKANNQQAIDEATIKELNAKAYQAFQLGKKAGVETQLLEENMQQLLDLTYYQMCNEMYKFIKLGPQEMKKLQADTEKLRLANDKEKALSEIYGSWKGHARANEIKDWMKALAGVGGATGVIMNAAKTAAKIAPK